MSKLRPHLKKILVFICLAAVLFSLLVLPSSAAVDEDLLNTTWIIPEDATISSGFGQYNVSGYITQSGSEVSQFTRLLLGYSSNVAVSDSVAFYTSKGIDHLYLEEGQIVISIVGGSDIGNAELMQWLRTNATQEPFHDFSGNLYSFSGVRLLVSNPDLSTFSAGSDVIGLTFVTGGVGYEDFAFDFISDGTRYFGLASDIVGPVSFTRIPVYTASSGWVDQRYRLIDFGSGSVISNYQLYNWILNNSQDVTESFEYERGYLIGMQQGIDSDDAKKKWFQNGYDEGLQDGINSSGSSSLGQNLIGDTLSAPFRALNGFTLFEAPNGTTITLGIVFGGMLGFVLLIAFLKLFAGG